MTNLYDFLRRLHAEPDKPLTADEVQWIEQYMTAPDNEIHFKSRRVGGTDDDPVMAQDYAIKGEGVDVFQLITEAMLTNPHWANLVLMAANYFKDHVPECTDCRQALIDARETRRTSWNFSPHKPE